MNLINDIFNTEPKIEKLIPFLKAICNHIKCLEVFYAFYYCEAKEPNPLNIKDDSSITMKKFVYLIMEEKYNTIFDFYEKYYPNMKLNKILNFINKNRCFVYVYFFFSFFFFFKLIFIFRKV